MLIQLIVIQAITFIAIVFVLRRLLYTETAKEAKRLLELKKENFSLQKELQQKIQDADAAYREKIAKAEEDIKRLRMKALDDIALMRASELEKTKAEAERIIKAAVGVKDKIREEILIETAHKAPEIALNIFKEALSPKVKEMMHEELLRDATARIRELDKTRFNDKITKAELIYALALKKDQKDALLAAVFDKLGNKMPFEEREDRGLVAGVVINTGGLVIDGSLANRLKQIGILMRRG